MRNEKVLLTNDNLYTSVRAHKYFIASMSPDTGLSASASPTLHTGMLSARAEAKRLSGLNPCKSFIILNLAGLEQIPSTPAVSIWVIYS